METEEHLYIVGTIYQDSYFLENLLDSLVHGDKNSSLNVWICSPGGSVIQGNSIASILKMYENTTCIIIGECSSIATVIALACKKVKMDASASWLIHEAWSGGGGTAQQLRDQAEELDSIKNNLAAVYAKKTGKSKDDILELMKLDKPITAKQALEWGFIDEIIHDPEMQKKMVAFAKDRKNENLNSHKQNETKMKTVLIALGLPENANESDALNAVIALKAKNTNYETAIAAIKKAQIDDFVAAVAPKTETEKNALLALANQDLENAKILFAVNKPAAPVSTTEPKQIIINDLKDLGKYFGKNTADTEDRSNWKIQHWQMKDPQGLAKMKNENRTAFDELLKKK